LLKKEETGAGTWKGVGDSLEVLSSACLRVRKSVEGDWRKDIGTVCMTDGKKL